MTFTSLCRWTITLVAVTLMITGSLLIVAKLGTPTPYVRAGYVPTSGSPLDQERAILHLFEEHVKWIFGVDITYEPNLPTLGLSISSPEDGIRGIWVRDSWNPQSKFENLAHEAAHWVCPPTLSRAEAEVFVEAVARGVCEKWQMPCTEQSERYADQYKQSRYILSALRDEIRWAVIVLSGL